MVDLNKFIEVELKKDDSFLVVKETLTRIGVASKNTNTLFQSCHILHKRGKFYIVHFKELFLLDGKNSSITDSDIDRRNAIAKLLEDWKLITIKNPSIMKSFAPIQQIKIISYGEKNKWNLVQKYNLGNKQKSGAVSYGNV